MDLLAAHAVLQVQETRTACPKTCRCWRGTSAARRPQTPRSAPIQASIACGMCHTAAGLLLPLLTHRRRLLPAMYSCRWLAAVLSQVQAMASPPET